MIFKVLWYPAARSELADVWLQAADRAVGKAAVHAIDRDLAAHPKAMGESREGGDPDHVRGAARRHLRGP